MDGALDKLAECSASLPVSSEADAVCRVMLEAPARMIPDLISSMLKKGSWI